MEKVSDLEKNNYKYLKQWLEKDEKTFISTNIFFHQTRKEMKKSLKLTKVKAENPRGLGVRSKRDKSSTRAYPTLPTTEEETVETETCRTKDWLKNKNDNGATKKEVSPKEDANAKPPDYDQSVGWPYQTPQHNS